MQHNRESDTLTIGPRVGIFLWSKETWPTPESTLMLVKECVRDFDIHTDQENDTI